MKVLFIIFILSVSAMDSDHPAIFGIIAVATAVLLFIFGQDKCRQNRTRMECCEMDNEKYIKRLDEVVDFLEKQSLLNDNVVTLARFYTGKDIHVFGGIDVLANAAGEKLVERGFCDEFPYKYFFIYKGYEFFQIEKERKFINETNREPDDGGVRVGKP